MKTNPAPLHSPSHPEPAAHPIRTLVVDAAHPHADDSNDGSTDRPFRTVSAAAAVATPGTKVLIHAGIYRERVAPAQGGTEEHPVIYEAAPGEQVCIRGSERVSEGWIRQDDSAHIYKLPLSVIPSEQGLDVFRLGHRGYCEAVRPAHPTTKDPLKPVRGQVFVDGSPFRQVTHSDHLADFPGTWMVDIAGEFLWMHLPVNPHAPAPADREVELSVRHRIFAPATRNLGYIQLRGIIFEHCANNHPTPQIGAVSTRSGHHWVIENCTIRHTTTVGLDIGSEWGIDKTPENDGLQIEHDSPGSAFWNIELGYHRILNNIISDNGLCGIMGLYQRETHVIGNIIERNNSLGFRTFEIGAVKFHFFFDGVIERNLIRDNDAYGIWLDNRYAGSRVSRNLILNSYVAGIFMELGLGPCQIDNNIIAYTRNGDGIYAHDASGLTIAHNFLYANAHCGVNLTLATDRMGHDKQPIRCSDNQVLNNIIAASKRTALSFPAETDRSLRNHADGNAYMGGGNPMDEGSGPDEPLFHINGLHNRLSAEDIAASLPSEGKVLTGASGGPLTVWQKITRRDTHSRSFVLRRDMLGSYGLNLSIIWDPAILQTECKPLDLMGPGLDYPGKQRNPETAPLPGPFRDLQTAVPTTMPLWPAPLCSIRQEQLQTDDIETDIEQTWAQLGSLRGNGL